MDLSFAPFDRHLPAAQPDELSVLMVGVAARQAASPTAMAQAIACPACARRERSAEGKPSLLQPLDGAFNGATAAAMTRGEEP